MMDQIYLLLLIIALFWTLQLWIKKVKREHEAERALIRADFKDPRYHAAAETARQTLALFDALREHFPDSAALYIGRPQEDGTTRPVIVLEKVDADTYIVAEAHTKNGKIQASSEKFSCATKDISDWSVFESEKKVHGAFLSRALLSANDKLKNDRQYRHITFASLDESRAVITDNGSTL